MAVPTADNSTFFVVYERGDIYGGHGALRLTQLALPTLPPAVTPTSAAQTCRDRFREPFASSSIWNVAIGSEAQFAHAKLFMPDGPCGSPPCSEATQFHNDQDFFLRASPEDPLTPW
eukprot:7038935-Prymnesium_polylepis.1